jgi:hypothetical protein
VVLPSPENRRDKANRDKVDYDVTAPGGEGKAESCFRLVLSSA